MNSTGITRDGAVLEGFTDCSIATNEKGGRSADSRIPFQRCVDYRRKFIVSEFPEEQSYPAVGPGGKLRVVVNDYGDARGFTKVWRQVEQRLPDISLVRATQAVQDFHRLVDKALYGTNIVPDCKRIEIDNVSIGYYEDDFLTYQETIYPVYVLHLTCEDDTSSHKTQVYVPAQWPPLEANIDAPSDGAVFNHGDPITFNGSAAGGAPPYTYGWESDVDGSLGSGASISVSDLSANQRSAEPTHHAIKLTVTDDQGQTAVSYISVLILPNTIPDAKQSADDTPVALLGPVIVGSFEDYFYVEDVDRTSGIGVMSDQMPPLDSAVMVHGVMHTQWEERFIVPTSIEVLGQTDPIEPLGTSLKSIGGGDFGTPPLGQKGIVGAYGLNNIGLLMRSTGVVQAVTATLFTMTVEGDYKTYVIPPPGAQFPAVDDFCVVTGVSAVGYAGPGDLWRLLLPRSESDIQVLQTP